jgi:hypothetical protein
MNREITKELWFDTTNFKHANGRIDEVTKRYAKECIKASLEKASEKTSLIENETSYVKQSEINIEENIVLL